MTPADRAKKMHATLAKRREDFDKQTIVVSAQWKITRPDHLNWSIIHTDKKGKERVYYYSKLIDVLGEIPHKILHEGQMKTLDDILRQAQDTHQLMEQLRFYRFENLLDDLSDAV